MLPYLSCLAHKLIALVGSSPENLVLHFFIQLLFFVRCENLYLMFSRLPSLLLMNLMCYVDFPVHFLVFLVSLLILLFLTNFFYPPHQLERRNPLLIFSTFNCQHTSTFMTSTIANPRLFFTKVDGWLSTYQDHFPFPFPFPELGEGYKGTQAVETSTIKYYCLLASVLINKLIFCHLLYHNFHLL